MSKEEDILKKAAPQLFDFFEDGLVNAVELAICEVETSRSKEEALYKLNQLKALFSQVVDLKKNRGGKRE